MSEWIKCSERMPEKHVEVLVFSKESSLPFLAQSLGEGHSYPWSYSPEGCTEDGGDPTITHWMPLPAPPEVV